jgi:hypothetical protein
LREYDHEGVTKVVADGSIIDLVTRDALDGNVVFYATFHGNARGENRFSPYNPYAKGQTQQGWENLKITGKSVCSTYIFIFFLFVI